MLIETLPAHLHDAAVALWHEVGLARPWNDADADLRRALDSAASTVLAAHDGSGLVGTVMTGYDGHRGWLYYVAVRPDRQGTGMGRTLVRAAESWLVEQGAPKANLMVRGGNEAVLGFYEGLGYERSDTVVLGRLLGAGA